jgi:ribosomal protein S24E
MEINITGTKENKVFGRKEVAFLVKFDSVPPSRAQAREKLVSALSCDPKLLVIGSMMPNYGRHEANGMAHVYNSEKELKVEHRHLLIRDGLAEKRKKEAKAAPAKKQ